MFLYEHDEKGQLKRVLAVDTDTTHELLDETGSVLAVWGGQMRTEQFTERAYTRPYCIPRGFGWRCAHEGERYWEWERIWLPMRQIAKK